MHAPKKLRFAVVFLIFAFGLSLGFPAEDIPETAYDESEALPYESTPLFSTVAVPAQTTQTALSSLHRKPGTSCPFPPARVRDTLARRCAEGRISLVLLCTLLC
jgi:hypothetical protein